MMIILGPGDISRLSPQCRAEIQRLVFEQNDDSTEFPPEDAIFFEMSAEDAPHFYTSEPDSEGRAGKRVIGISTLHAKALIANISERSLETLTLFAEGNPIELDQLVGPERPYENLTDLKRSFVGAVTRRLRTVTKNRQAALFLQKSLTNADGNVVPAISIRAETTDALREALGLPHRVQE